MNILTQISENLQKGNDELVEALTQEAIAKNLPPKDILDHGLIAGMNIISDQFKAHEIFLPDVLLAAKAMYAGMNVLKPLLIKDKIPSRGKVVMGTVQGDLHDIGKNLVSIMLQGAGYEIIDLGNDVSPEQFIEAAKTENANIIGMSALLTTTMPVMKKVVALLKEQASAGAIKTVVGGAPVNREFAQEIGADAYGFDAANAVEIVNKLSGH
ncbi:MAG: hypothetical protein A2Y62_20120 [Candidatus Fischerbacteria bacterium RBG_13_37_8]|uniref:Methyltransferase n=1 Tax=Candidatus Fischerbacteria bacterium RBG_13_37_8 TaxID=1817863 RepID=A0A1F5VTN7_9BACT|nr:MAG: hypothetical protein A2Y62_20120 [Candidatus Fischerbacteria bacterium RBG_13_37_8]